MSKQKTVKEKIYTKKAIRRDFKANWALYLMVVPFMVLTILFAYLPMGGILMAFENFKPKLGIWKSPWVHLKNFQDFFGSIFAWRVIRNTLIISFLQLLICFPAAIIFALLINELNVPVYVAENALRCVAEGTGIMLETPMFGKIG